MHGASPWRACSVTQSCPTLCHPMDCSLPGSSVHGIILARILEWVAMSSSGVSSQPRGGTHFFSSSCTDRWILYLLSHWGNPNKDTPTSNFPVLRIYIKNRTKFDKNSILLLHQQHLLCEQRVQHSILIVTSRLRGNFLEQKTSLNPLSIQNSQNHLPGATC